MFFLQFEVTPTAEHPQHHELGGAVVNCWVLRDTMSEAESAARAWFQATHWAVVSLDEAGPMTREQQMSSFPSGLPYFEQAETDEEVFVFHTYPLDTD